jgi:NAD+ synthase (glutamine-hydrolysing)
MRHPRSGWFSVENAEHDPYAVFLTKIALAQFNPTVGGFEGNRARILALARTAKSSGAELAVFPELCICGYPPQDLIERPAFVEWNQKELACLAQP